jgi:epoxyqueuosine reductase
MIRNSKSEIREGRSHISEISFRIREEARRLGFFKTGITPARPLPHSERFTSWVKEGFHGEMRYLERQSSKRINPMLVFPDVRSLVLLAMNYYAPGAHATGPLYGKISRYAWGSDYHEIVRSRLERLLAYIRTLDPSTEGICYADTGPVMEKVWGAQTALGWMGKHTNLITREKGSWFFLGTILLNIDLEFDAPEKDYCGECHRCIDACPTKAIVAPYVLDARRCISYVTIELRGSIPDHLRSLIGNRIYGCDECQEVCPWNRFAVPTVEKKFEPRRESLLPELAHLVDMTEEQFRKRFEGSAILRTKRDGFARNAVIALGNSGSSEAIPALKRALLDPSPVVRNHAEWALKKIAHSSTGILNPGPNFADNSLLE